MSDEKDKRLDSEEEEEWDTGLVTPEHQVKRLLNPWPLLRPNASPDPVPQALVGRRASLKAQTHKKLCLSHSVTSWCWGPGSLRLGL